jgi:biopolymer transport protein ExbB/TolQ
MNDWIRGAGPAVTLIWIVAGLGVLLILERGYVALSRSGFNGRPFIERIIQLVRAGKVEEAIRHSSTSRTVLADIALLILRTRTQNETDLQEVASAAELSLVPRLRRRLPYFTILAVIAILLGAVGLGDAMRMNLEVGGSLAGDAGRLAAGIRATEVGFSVAAALLLAQGFFTAQAEQVVEQVEELTARLVNALIDRPDVRLGHR